MSISVDTINLRFNVKPDYDQQQLQQLQEDLKNGQKELEKTRKAMDKLAKNGLNAMTKEEREEFDRLSKSLTKTAREVHENEVKMKQWTRSANISKMSIQQLGQRAKDLTAVLNNINPTTDAFREYKEELDAVKERMKELNSTSTEVGGSLGKFTKGINLGQFKTILSANAISGAVTAGLELVADYVGRAFDRVKTLVTESVAAAREAEGITRAFEQLDKPGILQNLRQATHGTVADLELMKAAVQANDFRLPLDQLGKYLEFAQLKAQQTGQSVDFLTTSIVTGLGRKSLQILDNLGLSASEVKEEMEKTGDMATAVGNIIDRQLAEAGEHFETAAEREERATTDVSNAQLELGRQMQRTFGIGSTSFGEMQAKAEAFILKGLTKVIIFCQDLYNRLGSVRLVVETVKMAFDTVFKVCEVGFWWLIDTIKGVARVTRDLAGMIEGVFTFDWDRIKASGQAFVRDIGKSIKEFVADGKDVGKRWGKNVLDSIDATMGKRKVKAPEISTPKRKTLPSVSENNEPSHPDKTTRSTSLKEKNTTTNDDEYRKLLADRERAYREYGNSLRQMRLNNLLSEKEYQEESYEAELKFLSDKAELQQQYGQDVTQTQQQYLDKMLQEATRRYNEQKKIEKEQQDKTEKELKASQQKDNKYLQEVEWQGQTFDKMRQLNEQFYEQGRISYEQYQQNLTEIAQREENQRQQIQQAAVDGAQQLLSSASSLFQAMQQRETNAVDAKYKKMIAAAKKQGKDTTKLEEQQELEKAAIKKKYADRQFKIQVLQIVANTAQGISKTIAELGMPWAIPFVAMAAAAGAMQLAAAKASADEAAGLYTGGYSGAYDGATVPVGGPAGVQGYTRRGNPKERAGMIPVHKNEFVANHHAVANPQVKPVLDVIDAHQRRGDIQMLNATRLLDEAYGRYRGGYTGTAAATSASSAPYAATPSQSSADLLPILMRIEENTARSLTVRRLREEISHEEQLERNARR